MVGIAVELDVFVWRLTAEVDVITVDVKTGLEAAVVNIVVESILLLVWKFVLVKVVVKFLKISMEIKYKLHSFQHLTLEFTRKLNFKSLNLYYLWSKSFKIFW